MVWKVNTQHILERGVAVLNAEEETIAHVVRSLYDPFLESSFICAYVPNQYSRSLTAFVLPDGRLKLEAT